MSKRSIVFLIIGIVLVVLGLFVGLTAGWDYSVAGDRYATAADFEPGQVTAVRAETDGLEIRIYESWDDGAEVDIGGVAESRVHVALEGETLVLRETKASFLERLLGRKGYVVLWLSAGDVTEVRASSSSGDVALSGMLNPELTISLASASGDVSVYDTQAASLCMESDSGGIYAGEVRLLNELRTSSSSGTVALSTVRCDGAQVSASSGGLSLRDVISSDVTAETTSGSVWLDDVRAESVRVSSSSGSVDAWQLDASDIQVKTSSGSVQLELEGRREDYAVFVSSSSGRVSGVEPGGDGDKALSVSTSSGSVDVSFTG